MWLIPVGPWQSGVAPWQDCLPPLPSKVKRSGPAVLVAAEPRESPAELKGAQQNGKKIAATRWETPQCEGVLEGAALAPAQS